MMVNVHDAKSSLSALLKRVEAGETVIIARAGTPVAELIPTSTSNITFGVARHERWVEQLETDDWLTPDTTLAEAFGW